MTTLCPNTKHPLGTEELKNLFMLTNLIGINITPDCEDEFMAHFKTNLNNDCTWKLVNGNTCSQLTAACAKIADDAKLYLATIARDPRKGTYEGQDKNPAPYEPYVPMFSGLGDKSVTGLKALGTLFHDCHPIPEPTIPTIPEPTIPEPTIPEPTIPEPTIPTIPEIPEPTGCSNSATILDSLKEYSCATWDKAWCSDDWDTDDFKAANCCVCVNNN